MSITTRSVPLGKCDLRDIIEFANKGSEQCIKELKSRYIRYTKRKSKYSEIYIDMIENSGILK